MALSMIESLFSQASITPQEEIDKICQGVLENLYAPDKSNECMNQLRQLYFILQASHTEPCLPRNMISTLVNMVSSMDHDKTKECLLCEQILSELLPRNQDDLGSDFYPSSSHQKGTSSANCLLLYLMQGNRNCCLVDVIPHAVRWMSSGKEDYNVQRQAFSFLVSLQVLHNKLVTEETMKTVNTTASNWLMNASLYQLPNPYTINPFKKDQTPVVNEVDGTPSRNFFTVLNVGQYYTNDQFLNIYCFSMLYKWLYHARFNSEEVSDNVSKSAQVFNSLVDKSIDYCFRILDQCERKSKVPSDTELQNCCLLEVVNILDMICKIEPGKVAGVFQEIRRLYNKLMQELDKPRLLVPILQFFLNHGKTPHLHGKFYGNTPLLPNKGKSVEHDPQEAYTLFFHKLLTQWYLDPAFSFDTITFIKDNLDTLCHNTSILSTYFPNILKMLAWNPRSYLADFEDILPALMSPSTAIEVFHMLLDLPCVTVALEITERCKKSEIQTLSSEAEPTNSLSAFQSALYRPMFNFFTRVEGGHGDTINRLSLFHNILADMNQHPRVLVCSQIVPVLLRVWFDVILEDASSEFLSHLIPVLLERTAMLYNIPGYQADVRKVLAEYVVHLLKKYPGILLDQASEIRDFLSSPRNISDREEFFANLVWCVGELCSDRHDDRCTAEAITRFFDTLEVLTYELSGMASAKEEISNSSKIICMLISAISKLASKCQDLIPRSILLLTKVAKQQQASYLDTETKDALVGRAQELINLLKLPNFANVVLNPSDEIETGRWHRDNTSLPITLRGIQHILS
uniref:AP-5 complex subunit zeta-1-like isoform X1 n=1 Tax=Crassostrea virginica TaxID=6565 RepID=A0A8B8CCF7_CRAVI|nr:AP-5 complex subunit zeta-1-like isoform X1 [Crassostrea virginica]